MSYEDNNSSDFKFTTELDNAEEAFHRQDYEEAINQIASIIVADPVNKKALTLLKLIFNDSSYNIENLTYYRKENENNINELAVLTYILGIDKHYDQSLVKLAKLLISTEETLYLYWLEDWLSNDKFFEIVSFDALKKALVQLMVLPNQAEFNHNIREIYENFLELLLKAEKHYDFDEQLMYIMAVLARRSLQYQRSILIAAKSYGKKPSYFNTLALAYAYKELKDYDNTVRFFQEAINFRLDVIEVKLDLADFLTARARLGSDDFTKGVQLYKEVVDIQPNHSWAYPSYLCYSCVLEPDAFLLGQLEKFANDNPANERAQELLQKAKLVQK